MPTNYYEANSFSSCPSCFLKIFVHLEKIFSCIVLYYTHRKKRKEMFLYSAQLLNNSKQFDSHLFTKELMYRIYLGRTYLYTMVALIYFGPLGL